MSSNLPGQHVHTIQLDSRCSCGQQAPLRWCRPDKFRKPQAVGLCQGLSLYSIRAVCRCQGYIRYNDLHSRLAARCKCPPCRSLRRFRPLLAMGPSVVTRLLTRFGVFKIMDKGSSANWQYCPQLRCTSAVRETAGRAALARRGCR